MALENHLCDGVRASNTELKRFVFSPHEISLPIDFAKLILICAYFGMCVSETNMLAKGVPKFSCD